MDLAGLHSRIARAIGKGTSLDTSIPEFVEEAVQWMEANYNFQYMEQWLEIPIDPTADNPHIISLYNTPIKKIEAFRLVVDDPAHTATHEGRFRDLKRIKPKDRQTRFRGPPSGYWLNGVSSIVLDAIPDEEFLTELHAFVFSVWQPTQPDFRHYLIDRFRTPLIARTCMLAAIDRRDPRMFDMYKKAYLDAQTVINVAEEDLQFGSGDIRMDWSPETQFNVELDELVQTSIPSP